VVLEDFHKRNPLKPGISKEVLRADFKGMDQKVFELLVRKIESVVIEKDILRLDTFRIFLSEDKKLLKDKILKVLEQAKFQPPSKDEIAKSVSINREEAGELLKIMASENILVRINDSLYIPSTGHSEMMKRLQDFFDKKKEMSVAEFRDVLGTSRKYAIPFLEYLDSNKITLRVGEVRKFLVKRP
jgi:selenocysteine-specific elongation factor